MTSFSQNLTPVISQSLIGKWAADNSIISIRIQTHEYNKATLQVSFNHGEFAIGNLLFSKIGEVVLHVNDIDYPIIAMFNSSGNMILKMDGKDILFTKVS